MSNLPTLSEEEIEEWTDSRSFQRGASYYRGGAIRNPRVQGNRLLADCSGSAATPYRVEITLNEDGIQSGYCSCPVGAGGDCKHCIALLLTWLYEPDSFITQEVVESHLAERSREELVALIEQMIARYPDLSTLLEMPLAGVSPATTQLDPAVIRRQISSAVENLYYDGDWRGGYASAHQLYSITGQGDDYFNAGEVANAATVYITLAEEVIENYEEMYDEEGEIVSVVDNCAQGLSACLEASEDVALRDRIVQALFAIYEWDIQQGGIGGGDSAVGALQTLTTDEEKAEIAALLRAKLATKKDSALDNWGAQALGGLLLQMEAETLSDEEYLRICRETGRTTDLIQRLLHLDRASEAADEVRTVSGFRLLPLARMIYDAGHTHLAEQLLHESLEAADQRSAAAILEVLIAWAQARQAQSEALALALRLLESAKSLEAYQQVREIAESMGVWQETRREILGKREAEGNFMLLTQIYVDEKQVDNALRSLEQNETGQRRSAYFWVRPSLRLSVAQLAEEERPHAAIAIYRAEAQNQINGRKRDTYAEAARYLQKIKALYTRLDENDAWARMIGEIRQENKRLRALMDELKRAGL